MSFRYVTHDDVADYIAKGWEVESDLAVTHHGRHAVLMVWRGEGEPN